MKINDFYFFFQFETGYFILLWCLVFSFIKVEDNDRRTKYYWKLIPYLPKWSESGVDFMPDRWKKNRKRQNILMNEIRNIYIYLRIHIYIDIKITFSFFFKINLYLTIISIFKFIQTNLQIFYRMLIFLINWHLSWNNYWHYILILFYFIIILTSWWNIISAETVWGTATQ